METRRQRSKVDWLIGKLSFSLFGQCREDAQKKWTIANNGKEQSGHQNIISKDVNEGGMSYLN
jgi:hypothetical protein